MLRCWRSFIGLLGVCVGVYTRDLVCHSEGMCLSGSEMRPGNTTRRETRQFDGTLYTMLESENSGSRSRHCSVVLVFIGVFCIYCRYFMKFITMVTKT